MTTKADGVQKVKLTRIQRMILRSANEHPHGYVIADAPTGPALEARGLLVRIRGTWAITESGRKALGIRNE